ncbi:MAG: DUF3987 domain-containing protein, partial [Candidatus Brocadiales bacterium]|nr:DUF3987 domain-containing protein [Candidatus Brocadiales bacterium]
CEGEKDVDLLWKEGFVATTCPMGAGKWKADYNKYFEDRNVVIIPDNDDVGRKHAVQIAHSLKEIAETIKVVHLQNLKDHGDVSDFLDSHTVDELQIEIEKTAPYDFSQNDPAESGLNSLNSFYSHWGEVENFKNDDLPEIPAELLPGNYGKFAKALATATEVPEGLAVFGVLGVVSAAVSHRFCVSPKENWEEPINVYLLAALPPGNNKSTVLKACSKPLVTWENEQAEKLGPEIKRAESERKTMEKIIDRKRSKASNGKDLDLMKNEIHEISEMEAKLEDPPVLPQIFLTDATPESLVAAVEKQGGKLAVISDEGGIMEVVSGLYSGGKANINIILNGTDGGYVRVERKDRSFDLCPYLTFCLFAQPVVISGMGCKKAFAGNGMLERFLYLLPQSKLGYRTHDTEPVSKDLQDRYNQQVIELLNEFRMVAEDEDERIVLKLDEQSHKKWREFQNQTEKELKPNGKLYLIGGWGGKIWGVALRIAGLIHIMKGRNMAFKIDPETMGNALILATHLKEHALAAFGLMKTDEATHKASVVLNWIKDKGEQTFLKSDCHKAVHGQFENVKVLEEALGILKDRNIVSDPDSVTAGRGRPSIVYRVNPAVFSDIN